MRFAYHAPKVDYSTAGPAAFRSTANLDVGFNPKWTVPSMSECEKRRGETRGGFASAMR
jgi:hypothetical protein